MRTISRLYDNYGDAVAVVRDLEAAPLRPDREISLVANENATGRDTTTVTTETQPEGHAGSGAGIGAAVGGGVGLLTGLGLMAIPGIGPLVAAGWLVTTLAGAAVGAGTGGLVGALVHSGVEREEAETYDEGVRRGNTLVSVRVDESDVATVETILNRRTAVDWRTRRGEYEAGGWTSAR